jgi:hypothetical protein
MSDGKNKKRILDQESWDIWYELEKHEGSIDRWCCRISKEGTFEEDAQRSLHSLCGKEANLLAVNFCIQCGQPVKDESEIVVHHEGCCCELTSLMEFIEIFEPETGTVHRLRGNFCFNCGAKISGGSDNTS